MKVSQLSLNFLFQKNFLKLFLREIHLLELTEIIENAHNTNLYINSPKRNVFLGEY